VISPAVEHPGLEMFAREQFLLASECAEMRRCVDLARSGPAFVFERDAYVVRERHRRTLLANVSEDIATWLTAKMSDLRPQLEERFAVHLAACASPEFLKYGPGDLFRPHRDTVDRDEVPPEVRERAISVIVFFNDQTGRDDAPRYSGGELVLFRDPALSTWATSRVPLAPAAGTLLAFRSNTLHEVREVTAGLRYTAVSWFYRGGS
jgi:SM-20-related protein